MTDFSNGQILEEASTWFVEFRTGKLNDSRRDDFMSWLRRSPDHIRAYLEISRTYVQLPREGAVSGVEIDRLIAKAEARWGSQVMHLDRPRGPNEPAKFDRGRRTRLPFATAASVLLSAVAALTVWVYLQQGLYATAAGEGRTVTLVDGSRVELNGHTRLRVSYSKHQRSIKLLEGQALFQVAKDKSRPFIVDTGIAQIRAVGTAFDVHKEGPDTTVTVLEGTVAVISEVQHPTGHPLGTVDASDFLVTAGQQAVVTPHGNSDRHPTNVSAVTAWTRGQLEFEETPLTQVAEQFNRSSPRPLVLDSQNLSRVRISGIYSSVDPASLILFLRNQPDLEVTESQDQIEVRSKVP